MVLKIEHVPLLQTSPAPSMAKSARETRPSLSLVAYGDDEEEDEGARSSDDDLLVPRKRARVQKTEEGERCSN